MKQKDTQVAPQRVIRVTPEHIEHGIRNDSKHCAFVKSLEEQGTERVDIHRGRAAFTEDGWRYSYVVPPKMATMIYNFDKYGPSAVKPCVIRLREGVRYPAARTGAADKTQKTRHAKGGRRARRGYTGPRRVLTKTRMDGFVIVKEIKA